MDKEKELDLLEDKYWALYGEINRMAQERKEAQERILLVDMLLPRNQALAFEIKAEIDVLVKELEKNIDLS